MPPKSHEYSDKFKKSKNNVLELKHINNINYSGFHPLDKKKTIKKVNEFIDKFNKCHNKLNDEALTQCYEFAGDKAVAALIQDSNLDKQTYTIYMSEHHELWSDLMSLTSKLYENRYKDMKKKLKSIIDPKSKDKKLTISKINQEIDTLIKALSGYEKEQLDEQTVRIKQKAKDRLTLLINKINTFMHQKHEHKRAELLKHLEKLKTYNVSKEAECLRALKKVLEGSKKKLKSNTIELFNNKNAVSFLQNIGVSSATFRQWEPFDNNQNYILKAPKGIEDKETRHVILNFYGIITEKSDCDTLDEAINLLNKQLDDHAEWNEELSEQLKRLDPRNKSQNALYLKELLNVIEDKNNKLSDGAIKFFNDLGGFKTWKQYDDKNEYQLYEPSGIFDKETRHVILNFYKIISNDADRKSLDKLIDLMNKQITTQALERKALLTQLSMLESDNNAVEAKYLKELKDAVENSKTLSQDAKQFFNNEFSKKTYTFHTWKQYDDKNEYQLYEPSNTSDKETRHIILNFYKIISDNKDSNGLKSIIKLLNKQKNNDSEK